MTEVPQSNLEKSKLIYSPNLLSFVFSIIGGVLMIIASIMFTMMMFGGSNFGMMNYWGRMMGGYAGMMGSIGMPMGFMPGLGLIGLVAGIIVTISSVMVYLKPFDQRAWGVIILVFSFLSFAGMGGFWVGGILGIIGGVLALSNYRQIPS